MPWFQLEILFVSALTTRISFILNKTAISGL